MKQKNITLYKCDFCNEMFHREEDSIKHELNCGFDPKNRDCYTCGNSEIGFSYCRQNSIITCKKKLRSTLMCDNWKLAKESYLKEIKDEFEYCNNWSVCVLWEDDEE
jgi:hypothetical protein